MSGAPRAILRGVVAAGFAGMGVLHGTPSGRRTMRAMIPPGVRRRSPVSPDALVLITGACELAGAAGLLVRRTRRPAAAALVVFLAAVFPANAYAARDRERFGTLAVPLVPRLAGQVALAVLVAVAASD